MSAGETHIEERWPAAKGPGHGDWCTSLRKTCGGRRPLARLGNLGSPSDGWQGPLAAQASALPVAPGLTGRRASLAGVGLANAAGQTAISAEKYAVLALGGEAVAGARDDANRGSQPAERLSG